MSRNAAMQKKAAELGKLVARMTSKAESGHTSSSLSLAHVVTYLMYGRMQFDPSDPWNLLGDRLVLSEGHAVPIIYAAYADLGGAVGKSPADARPLRVDELDTLRALDSVLDGHPNPAEGFPFFDAATGSLGMGLSVAAGLAAAARLDGSPRRLYVLIGDGESREGQIWEAFDFIVDHKLKNITVFLNCNGQGQAANVSPQQSAERLAEKARAFGWAVESVDGHDPAALAAAFEKSDASDRPLAIVGRTIKGWGATPLQQGNWHGKPPSAKELPAVLESLQRIEDAIPAAEPLGRPSLGDRKAGRPLKRVDPTSVQWPGFGEAMAANGFGDALKKNALGTRKAYGAAVKVAGDLVPQVVCIDGDVSNSTFADIFHKAHPERFFEGKIAEQNMVSVGVGFSAAGHIPFVSSFAKFIARAYDQVELASISRANLKLVGSHSGISLGADGPSQMAVADVAFFRAYASVLNDNRTGPLCWVYQPSDAVSAYALTRLMLEWRGMCYMRTHRTDVPVLYDPSTPFEPGGFHVLANGNDLALLTSGYMVHVGKTAVELLARQGVQATLIDSYSLPIQRQKLLDVLARAGRRVLVFEDNYGGGWGAEVAELCAQAGGIRVDGLHVQRVPKSAYTADEILDYCGVGAKQVADHALSLLKRPG